MKRNHSLLEYTRDNDTQVSEIRALLLINLEVQGQHPHQWAPFQVAGLLHAWQISHQISRYVYHEGR